MCQQQLFNLLIFPQGEQLFHSPIEVINKSVKVKTGRVLDVNSCEMHTHYECEQWKVPSVYLWQKVQCAENCQHLLQLHR